MLLNGLGMKSIYIYISVITIFFYRMYCNVNISNPINVNITHAFGILLNEESFTSGVLTSGSGQVAPFIIKNEVGDQVNIKYYNSAGKQTEFTIPKDGEYAIKLSDVTTPATSGRSRGMSYSEIRFSKSNSILLTVGKRSEWECAAPIPLSSLGLYAIPLLRTSTTGSANSLRRIIIMAEIKPENGNKYVRIKTGVQFVNYFNCPLEVRVTSIESILILCILK